MAWHDGRRRVVAATDEAASRLGLRTGMAVAQALAMVPNLHVAVAEPDADADALQRLALWCHRYTPLTCPCPPDGLWLEVAGSAHLFGGERGLLAHLLDRLRRSGVQARAAIADTPGAAHALARHAARSTAIAAPGEQAAALANLPVACLRLAPELETTLRQLGFKRVQHLVHVPRALLARRFGPDVALRLDQAQGTSNEPLVPLRPLHVLHRRQKFLEPLSTPEALTIAVVHLVEPLCEDMERLDQGARRMDLLFERIDHQVVALRIGTVQPSRDAAHLMRLLLERLDTVEPGPGIEAMDLAVPLAEPLRWAQQESGTGSRMLSRLIDRLSNRLGRERVYRATPAEAPLPEHLVHRAAPLGVVNPGDNSAQRMIPVPRLPDRPARPGLALIVSALNAAPASERSCRNASGFRLVTVASHAAVGESGSPVVPPWRPRHDRGPDLPGITDPADAPRRRGHGDRAWPSHLRPPARLLAPPCRVIALASLPHEAPVAFTWRRRYRVCRSEGPERMHEAWWHGDHATDQVRDYFQVEVEGGQRFWLFRRGNGLDLQTGDLSWFLHGVF